MYKDYFKKILFKKKSNLMQLEKTLKFYSKVNFKKSVIIKVHALFQLLNIKVSLETLINKSDTLEIPYDTNL